MDTHGHSPQPEAELWRITCEMTERLRHIIPAYGLVCKLRFAQPRNIGSSRVQPDRLFYFPFSSVRWIFGNQDVCSFVDQLHCQAPVALPVDGSAGQLVHRRRRLQETRIEVIIPFPPRPLRCPRQPEAIEDDGKLLRMWEMHAFTCDGGRHRCSHSPASVI